LINGETRRENTPFLKAQVGLDGADLRKTNLRHITLKDAKLDGAILENANLRDSHLSDWTCVGSVDCLRLRTVRGKENIATNEPDLPTGVSPRSCPAG
jgi:hypothetical protein